MNKRHFLRYAAVTLSSTAGCVRTEPGSGVVIVFDGEIGTSAGSFSMDGTIVVGGGVQAVKRYEETTIGLYSLQGAPIHSEPVGILEASREVTVRIDQIPQYVIISSPGFWREPEIQVEYYRRTDEGYRVEYATSPEGLPSR